MKKCSYCHLEVEHYYLFDSKKDKVICTPCNTEQKRKYRQSAHGKKAISEASRRAYKRHPIKWAARSAVRYAVKKGTLVKPIKCQGCAEEKPLQGHHSDYSKPLEVEWLCSTCHAIADRVLEAA